MPSDFEIGPPVPEKKIFEGFLPYIEKKIFKGFLPYMGMVAILVM